MYQECITACILYAEFSGYLLLYSKIKGAEAEAAFEELAKQSGGIKRKTSSERDLRDKISHLEQDLKHRELTMKDLRVNFYFKIFVYVLQCTTKYSCLLKA